MKNWWQNKTVLITGGASGIGKIMTKKLLASGARVMVWDINAPALAELMQASTLASLFGETVDISDQAQVKSVAAKSLQVLGHLDVLINNAGIVAGNKFFHEHNTIEIERTMSINANAPMHIAAEFLPGMLARNAGHICNIASSAGLVSNPRMSVYVASKWAITGWSDSLRLEMQMLKKNIHITTVAPYYINTGMFGGVRSRIPILDPQKVATKILRAIETKRIFLGMPWSYHFVRLSQGLMPFALYDWFVGRVLGIYKTMDEFKGRTK